MARAKYDVHPAVHMVKKWADELPAKTGRSLQEWADLVNTLHVAARKDRIAYLKSEHGLGTNSAMHIVDYAADRHSWDGDPDVYLRQADTYVEALFAGAKAGLRPIGEKLLTAARKLGRDVKICPCKTMVPFYRNRVFGQMMPVSKTRVELGLVLTGVPFNALLKKNPRANEKDRLKHIIQIESPDEVTTEVLGWLNEAYDQDG